MRKPRKAETSSVVHHVKYLRAEAGITAFDHPLLNTDAAITKRWCICMGIGVCCANRRG
jgi:hypothetical protein